LGQGEPILSLPGKHLKGSGRQFFAAGASGGAKAWPRVVVWDIVNQYKYLEEKS
jgi:hypothetical protein